MYDLKGSSHHSEGKKRTTIKSRGGKATLVVNEDLKISQIADLDEFVGQRMAHKTITEWMGKNGGGDIGLLSYLPSPLQRLDGDHIQIKI